MFKYCFFFTLAALVFAADAAEKVFDFSRLSPGQAPTGFVSKISGQGLPGEWKMVETEMPSALAPLSPLAVSTSKRPVLAQLSQDETDEHFPLFIFDDETYGDFTITTRFQCVSGKAEQMAGIAFRLLDEKNYYVVRASAKGNSFRFYKFVNGIRSNPIGPTVSISPGVWHEMSITCKGHEIRCLLNGKEVMPALTDHSFLSGKIAFWTKSDAVSYFTDTKITYTPREPFVQTVVRDLMAKYSRLIGLQVYTMKNNQIQIVASSNEKDIGEPGAAVETDVFQNEKFYYAKGSDFVSVVMPVRDRNGDTVGALRVMLKPFPGQTEKNALARAFPISQQISTRIQSAKDLVE